MSVDQCAKKNTDISEKEGNTEASLIAKPGNCLIYKFSQRAVGAEEKEGGRVEDGQVLLAQRRGWV